MAKQFIIKLSSLDKTYTTETKTCLVCGHSQNKEVKPLRDLEKDVLIQLFDYASARKAIKEAMLCYDCIDQVKNIPDTDTELEFTEQDLKYIDEGFEVTTGTSPQGMLKRPLIWLRECRELFRQLKDPKEKGAKDGTVQAEEKEE